MFYTACKNNPTNEPVQQPPERSREVTIQLADSLGSITISLPARYDTNFLWTDHSDCGKPCDRIKYRFQPKSLVITKESGFYWLGEPRDSIERFTVSHSGYFPFHVNTDSNSIFIYHKHLKNSIVLDPLTYKIRSDTVERIGDRNFSILVIDLFDSTRSQYSKKLLASTQIKGNFISLSFELLTKQKDLPKENFLANAFYYLRTVRVSKGE